MAQSHWEATSRRLSNRWLLAVVIAVPMFAAASKASMSFDEAIWTYIGTGWVKNEAKPYLDRFDNKPPGVLLIFGLGGSMAGVSSHVPRMFGVAAIVVAALLLYSLARTMLDRTAGALTMLLFGLAMPRAVLDGPYAAHTESFMVLFSVLSLYLLLSALQESKRHVSLIKFGLAGLSIGLAMFCFKQAAMLTVMGLAAFYTLHHRRIASKTHLAMDIVAASGGMVVAIAITLAPLVFSGVPLEEYWRAVWISPLYAGAVNNSLVERMRGAFRVWQNTELLLFVPLLGLFVAQRTKLNNAAVPFAGLLAWLIADFVGANAPGNYYGHQIKQALPPLALVGGLGVSLALRDNNATKAYKRATFVVLASMLMFMPYLTLLKAFERSGLEPGRELGTWIRDHSFPSDTIFPCGMAAMHILAWSGRPAPSRYFNFVFMGIPGALAELRHDLSVRPPRYVIVPEQGLDGLRRDEVVIRTQLASLIEQFYAPIRVDAGYRIYARRADR